MATGPTLLAIREALQRNAGDYHIVTASTSLTTNLVSGSFIVLGSSVSPHVHDGEWFYNRNQIRQTGAKNGGLTPSTGTQLVTPGWTAAVAGDIIEVTRLFPTDSFGSFQGPSYNSIIADASMMILRPDRISLTIFPNQSAYDLSAYDFWLDREERWGVEQPPDPMTGQPRPKLVMLEPGPTVSGLPVPGDWRHPSLRLDAGSPYLELRSPFVTGTSGSLILNAMRPVGTLVSGNESTTGPTADSNTIEVQTRDIVDVATLLVYHLLWQRNKGAGAGGDWENAYLRQWQLCTRIKYFDPSLGNLPPPRAAGAAA